MAETLKIENFGPIKKANLKLGKTTVFIGEQSSGKSTIAKLISICRDYELLEYFNPAVKADIDKLLKDRFLKFQILNYFQSQSEFSYENPAYRLSFSDGVFSLIALGEYKAKLEQLNTIHSKGSLLESDEYQEWEKFVRDNITSESPINKTLNANSDKQKIWLFFGFYSRGVVKRASYIPAERILISTLSKSIFSLMTQDIALPKSFIDFASQYESARRRLPELNIDLLGVKFSSGQGPDKIRSFNDDIELDISEASSGIQSAVPLIVTVSGLKRTDHTFPFYDTYVVEEPELSLYPKTQVKLVHFLIDKCTNLENELVITTHSPYVLTALNNLLFAYKTAAKKPDYIKEIDKVTPEASWLNPDEFRAYYVGNGTVNSIIDKDTGLIGDTHLDDASYEVGDVFDALMEIYKD